MKPIKALLIAYFFPPMGGAGTQRSAKFAKHLPKFGINLTVLAGHESGKSRWAPRDEVLNSDIQNDLMIERVDPYQNGTGGPRLGLLRDLLFFDSRFGKKWIREATQAAIKLCEENRPDVIIASMSPFESTVVCENIKRKFDIPWIADLRDPWALDDWLVCPSRWHRSYRIRQMGLRLRTASAVIMNTPEATKLCRSTFPSLSEKTFYTITNGYDKEDFPTSNDIQKPSDKFRILHTGAFHTSIAMTQCRRKFSYKLLGRVQNQANYLGRTHFYLSSAIRDIINRRPELERRIELVFIGKHTDHDLQVTKQFNLEGITKFCGYLNHTESTSSLATADLLFLPLHSLSSGKRSSIVPGKAYEYMASGNRILGAVPEGDAKDFLLSYENAITCAPDDEKEMAELIEKEIDRPKEQTTSYNKSFLESFERLELTHKLAHVIRETCQRT